MSGGNECVGADEPAHLGVVISGLEVIQLGLRIIHISTIAERIQDTESGFQRSVNVQNVAPGIVGVGLGLVCRVVDRGGQGFYLVGEFAVHRQITVTLIDGQGIGVEHIPPGQSAVRVIGIALDTGTVLHLGDSVIIVVGIQHRPAGAVHGDGLAGQIIDAVITIGHGQAMLAAGLPVLHQPLCVVIVVSRGDAGSGVCDGGQIAVVIVTVGHGIAGGRGGSGQVGLLDHPAMVIHGHRKYKYLREAERRAC